VPMRRCLRKSCSPWRVAARVSRAAPPRFPRPRSAAAVAQAAHRAAGPLRYRTSQALLWRPRCKKPELSLLTPRHARQLVHLDLQAQGTRSSWVAKLRRHANATVPTLVTTPGSVAARSALAARSRSYGAGELCEHWNDRLRTGDRLMGTIHDIREGCRSRSI